MAYGSDITEGLPYVLSNPVGAINYSSTGESYDIAIGGQPFFLAASDDTPYRRVTAQYRKQQYDQTREAGEQQVIPLTAEEIVQLEADSAAAQAEADARAVAETAAAEAKASGIAKLLALGLTEEEANTLIK